MRMVHTMICRFGSQVALSVVCLVFMSTGALAQDTPERRAFSTAEANTVRLASELEAFGTGAKRLLRPSHRCTPVRQPPKPGSAT